MIGNCIFQFLFCFAVGLEPTPASVHASTNGNVPSNSEEIIIDDEPKVKQQQQSDIDTTPVPMELEPELSGSAAAAPANTNPVVSMASSRMDLESELREFLEGGGAGSLATTDDVGIEQMLQ